MRYSVSIDVPLLELGLRFYRDALGLAEIARPVATYAVLECGNSQIGLIEKSAGSKPAEKADEVRRYDRHWTPLHIDFHVDDFEAFLAKAVNAGAKCERIFAGGARPPIAYCSDPSAMAFAWWERPRDILSEMHSSGCTRWGSCGDLEGWTHTSRRGASDAI